MINYAVKEIFSKGFFTFLRRKKTREEKEKQTNLNFNISYFYKYYFFKKENFKKKSDEILEK